ncbi:MAG: ABC transporter substrate-binding protein, partial [Magnetococcales bacterium]|nr:ABC transporter substrate-binding protein [Magnetococcales bacterium]
MKTFRFCKPSPIRLGFLPLTDCAPLVVAHELGFAARYGLDLRLSREGSWAAVRDKIAYGALECSQMLAGLTLALHLGVQGVKVDIAVPMALGQGGNAITLAPWLVADMWAADPEIMAGPRALRNRALAQVITRRRKAGEPPLRLAMVFPFSSHNYELRYWLAAAGVNPDRDVVLSVVPPPRMVESMTTGEICGFCVGEPWNQMAVALGVGEIVVTKHDLWPACPEKVLGMRADWLAENPETAHALVATLMDAGRWADVPGHREELAHILSQPAYVGVEAELLATSLRGTPHLNQATVANIPHYHLFHNHLAQFPWLSQ